MKKLNLFYVYDNIGCTAITGIIPASNYLTAALGFKNSYIDKKDKTQNPYNYKGLTLICIGDVNVDSDGAMSFGDKINWELSGKDIIQFISDEFKARGIDDGFYNEPEENE